MAFKDLIGRKINSPNLLLGMAFLAGCFLRFVPGILTNFPVNDGGMILTMIRDLRSNGFLLPVVTTYNDFNIPFAYPPFGMYAAAFLNSQLSVSEFELLRWLPPLISSATILAFYWLTRQILNSESKAVIAAMLYALLPGSFEWLIMGGGLTRSFGILFSLLAIGYVHRLFSDDAGKKTITLATLFSALTVLSHPEVGLQTAAICFVVWIFYGRNILGMKNAIFVALGIALLTAPWWMTVLYYHGFLPFQSAIQTGVRETLIASLFHTFFSTQAGLPLLPVFSLVGLFIVVRKRGFFLILWAFLPFFIDPRNSPAIAIFPLLMISSEGLYHVYNEFVRASSQTFPKSEAASKYVSIAAQASLVLLALYLFLASYVALPNLAAISLTDSDLETMKWVRNHTLLESRFLLMTNRGNISPMTDAYQEWFPTLAERRSQNTLQGLEWILGSNFFPYSQKLVDLQACSDVDCLNSWLAENNIQVDYILCYKRRAPQGLINSLQADSRYGIVYESTNAMIFMVLP